MILNHRLADAEIARQGTAHGRSNCGVACNVPPELKRKWNKVAEDSEYKCLIYYTGLMPELSTFEDIHS